MKLFLTVARHTIQTLLILSTLGIAMFIVWNALTYVLPSELVGHAALCQRGRRTTAISRGHHQDDVELELHDQPTGCQSRPG